MQTGGKSRQIKATSKQKDIKNALKILKIIKIFKKNIIKSSKIIKNHEKSSKSSGKSSSRQENPVFAGTSGKWKARKKRKFKYAKEEKHEKTEKIQGNGCILRATTGTREEKHQKGLRTDQKRPEIIKIDPKS